MVKTIIAFVLVAVISFGIGHLIGKLKSIDADEEFVRLMVRIIIAEVNKPKGISEEQHCEVRQNEQNSDIH